MPQSINWISIIVLCLAIFGTAHATERGILTGSAPHEAPDWFKESFLEIAEDVEEAGEANKHVMLFFQLNDCTYCDRMLAESFETDPYKSFIQTHFDVIAINVRGDREVVFNEEIQVTEKELAEQLNVFATPAMIFLNANNEQILRVNGYRAPQRFQKTLDYVSAKAYRDMEYAEYVDRNPNESVYSLRDHKLFKEINDLSAVKRPLLVIFENRSCYECTEFHDNLLSREEVISELSKFTVVRLDTDSDNTFIDVDGVQMTASGMAKKYQMTFRPGMLAFDKGELITRYDSLLYSYHFREGLRYVADGYYKKEDRDTYSARRLEELLSAGVSINLSD